MTPPTWAPSTADVALHVRARLKTSGGVQLSDFSSSTTPTAAEVEDYIAQAVSDVTTRVGMLDGQVSEDACGTELANLQGEAKTLAAKRAAMYVERTHWPNEIRDNASAYNALKAEWEEDFPAFTERVAESCGGGDGEAVGGVDRTPGAMDTFPTAPAGIGWRSVWN